MTQSGTNKAEVFDVAVVGGGLVGLSSALLCAEAGNRVVLLQRDTSGSASEAAAGMLAPAIDPPSNAIAARFGWDALSYFPSFVDDIRQRSGHPVPMELNGIIELEDERSEHAGHNPGGHFIETSDRGSAASVGTDQAHPGNPAPRPLTPMELQELEAQLLWPGRALLHESNGWVDNRALLAALRVAVMRHPAIHVQGMSVEKIEPTREVQPTLIFGSEGENVGANRVVLAAGAWSPLLAGLPRQIPVRPVRGQMLFTEPTSLRHVVVAPNGYAVPRAGGECLLGSTMEEAGFLPETTEGGLAAIRNGVAEFSQELGALGVTSRWAGLRPMTPDMLPIICVDPELPSLVYACGHSRNGILLGPLTGLCVSQLISGTTVRHDLSSFHINRFAAGAQDASA